MIVLIICYYLFSMIFAWGFIELDESFRRASGRKVWWNGVAVERFKFFGVLFWPITFVCFLIVLLLGWFRRKGHELAFEAEVQERGQRGIVAGNYREPPMCPTCKQIYIDDGKNENL